MGWLRVCFFFSSRRRHTIFDCDWSSDVCSSDLIFGDGAAAPLVVHSDGDEELIGPFVLGTDGRGARNLIVPVGGLRRRPSSETAVAREAEGGNWRSDQNLFMNGAEIFNFTLSTVPLAVQQLLEKANGGLQDRKSVV